MSPAGGGERELLLRVLAETGARTELPEPSWSEYLGTLLAAFFDWLAGGLRPLRTLLNLPHEVLAVAAWLLAALVVALLVLAFTRGLRRRRTQAPERIVRAQVPAAEAVPPETWADELERRLSAGQARAALEALWWWLAQRLLGGTVEASWTTRELLAQAQRGDLGGLGRTLDRLLYGAAEPETGDVRALHAGLREALR